MTNILYINASARKHGSLSRMLGDRFVNGWTGRDGVGDVRHRDVGTNPPPIISEDWIAAAFTPRAERNGAQHEMLALSDQLISEVSQADVIVIATPMYNYGMPGALKAWVDQVVRVNETFTFDLARGDYPLEPVLSGKTLVLLTSSGEFGFAQGGTREEMGHLVPHLTTVSKYLGAEQIHSVSIEYQEFGDARHSRSIATAKEQVDELLKDLSHAAA
ncbi:NAD(P)H-dependent oxidoreductase [Roseovarius sp. CAU 1744]|uniref:FMN-dependent NADH-azoreductase n=1 Tax=Roseovarius sp. CAU 1744 TaxID=3140368 RepID=UPI00325A8021